jgi:hypothetical protein
MPDYSVEDIETILEARRRGMLPEQIRRELAEPENPGEALGGMAASASALHAEAQPPGEEPGKPLGRDMMDAAFQAQGGIRAIPSAGMSDRSLNAAFSRLWERVGKGDPEALYKRPDESWQAAADRWGRSKS